jgi:hypothetical protein
MGDELDFLSAESLDKSRQELTEVERTLLAELLRAAVSTGTSVGELARESV